MAYAFSRQPIRQGNGRLVVRRPVEVLCESFDEADLGVSAKGRLIGARAQYVTSAHFGHDILSLYQKRPLGKSGSRPDKRTSQNPNCFSTRSNSWDGRRPNALERLNSAFREGLFSPRSN